MIAWIGATYYFLDTLTLNCWKEFSRILTFWVLLKSMSDRSMVIMIIMVAWEMVTVKLTL